MAVDPPRDPPSPRSATLAICCRRCPRVDRAPAPEVADIGAAHDGFLAAGWGYDGRGFAVCPDCRAADGARAAPC